MRSQLRSTAASGDRQAEPQPDRQAGRKEPSLSDELSRTLNPFAGAEGGRR